MAKKSRILRIVALCLAAAMLAGMITACGNSASESESGSGQSSGAEVSNAGSGDDVSGGEEGETGTDGEIVTLTILQVGSGLTEEDNSLVAKAIAENTGVDVQPIVVSEERLNVLMASGDMGADLITAQGGTGVNLSQRLIEGELVQPLDDLIASYGQSIQENAPEMLEFCKKFGSLGRDKIYFVRSSTGDFETISQTNRPHQYGIAPFIRWDYYEELGSPQVTNEDEFLDMLRQMQDKHPQNGDGQATYAMSLTLTDLWNIFTFYSLCSDFNYMNGYYVNREGKNFEITSNVLEPDDGVWRTFAYYNKAHRLGILDPESFTQKGENVTEKAVTSRMFYTENSWNSYNSSLMESEGEQAGFEPLYEAFPTVYGGDEGNYGWNYQMGISSKCENPEAAMKWINYLYDWDGARLRYNGIEGVHWSYEDGVPTIADEVFEMGSDEDWAKENGLGQYANYTGFFRTLLHPDGYAVDLQQTPDALKRRNLPIDQKYSEKYGAEYPGQVPDKLTGENGTVRFWLTDAVNMMPAMPDDLSRIQSKGDDILLKAAPKLIMADTEEEFIQARDETIKSLENIGIQQLIDWVVGEYNQAKATIGG